MFFRKYEHLSHTKREIERGVSYGLKSKSYNVSPNIHSSNYNGIMDNSNVWNLAAKQLPYHFWPQLLRPLQKLHFHFLSPEQQTSQFIIRKTFLGANKIYLGSPCPTRTRVFFASWTTSLVSPSTWVAGSANKNMRSKQTKTGSWPSLLHGTWNWKVSLMHLFPWTNMQNACIVVLLRWTNMEYKQVI